MTVSPQLETSAVLRDGLERATHVLEELQSLDLHDVDADTLHAALRAIENLGRRVEALSTKAVAAAEADGRWATSGARSYSAWLRQRTGRHGQTAARMARQARALRDHLPATARALEKATISQDHVQALVRYAIDTPARRAQLGDPEMGEAFLVGQAQALDATAFTTLVRHWSVRADPEASDRAWKDETAREELVVARTTGGYVVQGWLNEVDGDCLTTALDARIGVPAAGDTRTRAQRRAAALTSLARLALDSGVLQPGARIRPHLAVTVPFDTLQRLVDACTPVEADAAEHAADGAITTDIDLQALTGAEPATLADGTPIPYTLLARLACQSHLHRVVFGPASEILDSGREERLFTAAQTRAIIARDRHCQYPGCNAPPGEGEIHHSIWWYAHHGRTRAHDGVLACWYHHDYVHRANLTVTRTGDGWVFTRPDGTVIGPVGAAVEN